VLLRRQVAVGNTLKLLKQRVLLVSFDKVNNTKKHAQQPITSPIRHELRLLRNIRRRVVVVEGLTVLAPKEHLPDKIERVRAAAEALVD
jgi:hypothetical protein